MVGAGLCVCGVLAVAACGGGRGTPTISIPAASGRPKPPPAGAVVLAREAGRFALGLAVSPRTGGRLALTATVVGPDGRGADGLDVSFMTAGTGVRARTCGSGCYTASVPRAAAVSVRVGGRTVRFPLPGRIPAPAAGALVHRATTIFRRLHSVAYVEALSSAPGTGIVTRWTLIAPDRLEYRIRGGASGIVIGERRWDKASPRSHWVRSATQILRAPQPLWGSEPPSNAHLLATERPKGRLVDVVSFYQPAIPAWFTIRLDRRTLRPLSLEMTAAAHFMHHDYLSFDRPLKIRPPEHGS